MSEDPILFILIVLNLILSLVVGWAATRRGYKSTGWFFLSLFISPILALLVLMAAGNQKKKDAGISMTDYLVWKQTQALSPTPAMQAAAAMQAGGLPKPLLSKWHVARGADNLGEFSHAQILEFLQAGALTPTDLYWDTQAHEWLELAAHPRLG
jgi:hypothetical protein